MLAALLVCVCKYISLFLWHCWGTSLIIQHFRFACFQQSGNWMPVLKSFRGLSGQRWSIPSVQGPQHLLCGLRCWLSVSISTPASYIVLTLIIQWLQVCEGLRSLPVFSSLCRHPWGVWHPGWVGIGYSWSMVQQPMMWPIIYLVHFSQSWLNWINYLFLWMIVDRAD